MLIIILYTFLVVKRNSAVLFIICEIFVIIVGKINCVEMTSVAAWVVELCMEKINVRHCNTSMIGSNMHSYYKLLQVVTLSQITRVVRQL